MSLIAPQLILILGVIVFMSSVLQHLVKKNRTAISLYALQSGAIAILLTGAGDFSTIAIIAIVVTAAVKVILAPYFLARLVRRNQLRFSSTTYLSSPETLLVLALIVALSFSHYFAPLANLSPESPTLVLLSLASFFISLFLLVNKKGALSQMLGILSVENSIVAFALFTGLEQSPALELGITFDILVWVAIATVFISMLYRQFGSLDVTLMKNLSDTTL